MKFIKNSLSFWGKKFPFKNSKSHKYNRGKVVVVVGEKRIIGASILCTESALRTGGGSVKTLCTKKTFSIF